MEDIDLLGKFDCDIELYKSLAQSMNSLVSALISSSNILPHSISYRVKERSSLARKIQKKDKYSLIEQITDIVGLRIITHYSDEVDRVAEIIENEFLIDSENSIDKRSSLDPDRFGYLSLHYVVQLKPERCNLLEYKRFNDLKFEIQIRSILQHTWAEIEHDIGYKSKVEIPKPIRRKFSRLAGLLEVADDQFVQIRDDLDKYEKTIQETIQSNPENISIDAITVYEYINNSKQLKDLDNKVVKLASLQLNVLEKRDSARYMAGRLVKYLQDFGIDSISRLDKELLENESLILKRARDIRGNNEFASRGISIIYLHQVLMAKFLNKEENINLLNKMGMSSPREREACADYLSNFINQSM